MKHTIYFHTDDHVICLQRVAALIAQGYRLELLIAHEQPQGGSFCVVKARRTVWTYLASLVRARLNRGPVPRLTAASSRAA